MVTFNFRVVGAVVVSVALTTGCTSLANSSVATDRLKMVSAGYTGCRPDANDISNVIANLDGSGLWNATCKGKVYLCSAVGSGQSESFSCAPEIQ
jgi:outer membrane murein-binding lipoprotein Lpp